LLRDVSPEATLQQRVQKLHEQATRDPLTWVANRAEFDRLHPHFVRTHLDQSLPCSLIMCDVDHFKQVNDQHGHQAGDEALIRFAALLKRSCREGDLVARYGGEEFVLVCADCGNGSATERAEQMRNELLRMPMSELGGKNITASFGVTELQSGDTAEAMLRRADRALLEAKRHGRNRVVQLGSGMDESLPHRTGSRALRQSRRCGWLIDQHLTTSVPLRETSKTLRGFVSDHKADIVSIDNNRLVLRVNSRNATVQQRRADRPTSFIVDLTLTEQQDSGRTGRPRSSAGLGTKVHIIIRPQRQRDRRDDRAESAHRLLASLKSYLMARDGHHQEDESAEWESPHGKRAHLHRA
jgi:diguanylate cyclase (GGDEF)-like protein